MRKILLASAALATISFMNTRADAQSTSPTFAPPTSVGVTSLPALPAGSNSIGTVVLGAGSAAVGSVTVSSLPSLPAGSNLIGTVNTLPATLTPTGFQQITSLSTATSLTVPATSTMAVIEVEGAPVRWRDDGTAPTASVGMGQGTFIQQEYRGNLSAIQFIQQSSGAILNISYYH